MLNELDKELERRGHKFVRYADDLLIFCKSRKASQCTYGHIVPFIEGKLFLKVNQEKTKVAYIRDIKFLSYAFGRRNGKCQYLLPPESIKKMKHKICELTSRSNGWGYDYRKKSVFNGTFVVGRTIFHWQATRTVLKNGIAGFVTESACVYGNHGNGLGQGTTT